MLTNNINLNEIIIGIVDVLGAEPKLVGDTGLLAVSKSYIDGSTEGRLQSIVPMTKIMDGQQSRPTPLIGIRSGQMTRVGFNSYDVFVFIRCYTSLDKAFVENNEIMSLVNTLLDRQIITVPTAAIAEMTLEQVSGEEYDEGYKLNYRESQFRLNLT